jgi:biopolymer transport protein ExbD
MVSNLHELYTDGNQAMKSVNGQGITKYDSAKWSPSRALALRAAKRRTKLHVRIDPVPFVAVMLVILFMFMANAEPFHRISVALPHAQNATRQPGARREDAMPILITRDGRFYFRSRAIMLEDLPGQISKALEEGSEMKIYLSIDSRARNADAEAVIEQIRLTRVNRIAFITDKPQTATR